MNIFAHQNQHLCEKYSEVPVTVALLPWGDLWEDFLDSIGVSLETFCTEGPGGWMLGYIEALRRVGIRTVLILISAQVDAPRRYIHAVTGATITVLPVPKLYRKLRPYVLNPYKPIDDSLPTSNAPGARLWSMGANLMAPYVATPVDLLSQELRRENCCAIFCQDYESPRFDVCVGLGQWLNLPVFACFQSGSFDLNPFGRLLRRFTLPISAGLAIGSQTEIQRVASRYRLTQDQIVQIFNPVDVSLWQSMDRAEARRAFGLSLTAEVVVWHGRIEFATKRLDMLLDAWEQVCRERPHRDLHLMLMGIGQDAELLHQRLAQFPWQNVRWIDRYTTNQSEICQFLSTGDIYAFTSSYEGFPVAPIEAMACGLPLVATDASGVPDLLEEGEASGGVLIPRGDVGAFAEALGQLLDNPDRRRELSQKARYRIESAFSLEAIGQQLLTLFRESGIAMANQ